MTERATGRHRAPTKPSTSLSTLTGSLSVVGDYVGSVRRSGVIIAMSSGLVASMALPAQAVNAPPEQVGPASASIPLVPAGSGSSGSAIFTSPEGGLLALPPEQAAGDSPVAAPAAATVDFDHSAFTLVPAATSDDENRPAQADDKDGGSAATPSATTRKQLRAGTAATTKGAESADVDESRAAASAVGARALAIAFRYQGTPYLWGGRTPRGFDCSGFTSYVYGQLGKRLGRTVSDQRGDVTFVPRSRAKAGDLVFFGGGHVGIYIGGNKMIDAPRRGKTIQPRKIYSSRVQFGRVP